MDRWLADSTRRWVSRSARLCVSEPCDFTDTGLAAGLHDEAALDVWAGCRALLTLSPGGHSTLASAAVCGSPLVGGCRGAVAGLLC